MSQMSRSLKKTFLIKCKKECYCLIPFVLNRSETLDHMKILSFLQALAKCVYTFHVCIYPFGSRGGTVVKILCYKSEGR